MNTIGNHSYSIIISDYYWKSYIIIKHSSEIFVLFFALVISTTVKYYDNNKDSYRYRISKKMKTVIIPSRISLASDVNDISNKVIYSYDLNSPKSYLTCNKTEMTPLVNNNILSSYYGVDNFAEI